MFNSRIQRLASVKMLERCGCSTLRILQCFPFRRLLGISPYKISTLTFKVSKQRYILITVIIYVCCASDLLFIHDIAITEISFGDAIRNFEAASFYTFSDFIIIIANISSGSQIRSPLFWKSSWNHLRSLIKSYSCQGRFGYHQYN